MYLQQSDIILFWFSRLVLLQARWPQQCKKATLQIIMTWIIFKKRQFRQYFSSNHNVQFWSQSFNKFFISFSRLVLRPQQWNYKELVTLQIIMTWIIFKKRRFRHRVSRGKQQKLPLQKLLLQTLMLQKLMQKNNKSTTTKKCSKILTTSTNTTIRRHKICHKIADSVQGMTFCFDDFFILVWLDIPYDPEKLHLEHSFLVMIFNTNPSKGGPLKIFFGAMDICQVLMR